jgi:hypothetical protein
MQSFSLQSVLVLLMTHELLLLSIFTKYRCYLKIFFSSVGMMTGLQAG